MQGAEPSAITPEGLTQYVRDGHKRWKHVIKSANIRVELSGTT